MKHTFRAIAFALGLLPAIAAAQVPNFPQTLPANSVVGRLGIGPGPSQAIPITTIFERGATAAANKVFAGPASGAAAGANFRSLVGADLPNPGASSLGGVQSKTCSSSNWINALSTGGILGCSQPTLDQIAAPTSAVSLGNQNLNFIRNMLVTGSSSGSITLQPQAAAGTYNWNWPTTAGSAADILTSGGGSAAPMTWTTPGDITRTNDTNVTLTLGGTPTAALLKSTSLTLGWTGSLAVSRGGTGDTGTAWTAYTPTLGCGSGTLTSASATGRSKTIGKTALLEIAVTITTNGTCGAFVTATLPGGMTAAADTFFGGKARAVSGKLVGAAVQSTASTLAIGNYDNTYPGANGEVIVISGVVEIQ